VLKLRRGVVVSEDPLTVEIDGAERRAWADEHLVGEVREGDELIVNVEALDLGLGSGGFDVVHVNLTRGLEGGGSASEHVMKLNYTSLQHPVSSFEEPFDAGDWLPARRTPVLACFLHGQVAPAAWAAGEARPGIRIGYVQTSGGALPGSLSRDVVELRERGLIVAHATAGPCYGGELEAISVAGALHAAAGMAWDAVIAGPGPGILGSATRYGHGGMGVLNTAHTALALGLPTAIAPRLSAGDPRPRHRGVSHHTEAVLGLLLGSATVAVPEGSESAQRLGEICGERHHVAPEPVDVDGYAASGLPARTMGRGIDEDPDFFAGALAGGRLLASLVEERE
jgi:hypothetical protein